MLACEQRIETETGTIPVREKKRKLKKGSAAAG